MLLTENKLRKIIAEEYRKLVMQEASGSEPTDRARKVYKDLQDPYMSRQYQGAPTPKKKSPFDGQKIFSLLQGLAFKLNKDENFDFRSDENFKELERIAHSGGKEEIKNADYKVGRNPTLGMYASKVLKALSL